jgi:hypothetical protein
MEQARPTDMEERPSNVDPQKTDILNKIIKINSINNVVPIISNSFRIEQVFQNEKKITDLISKTPEFLDEDLTIDEQLTKIWAKQIKYPMTDDHNLAKVAQYYQVEQEGTDVAKEEYLEFLNLFLLELNEKEPGYEEKVKGLKREAHTLPFSEIVRRLDYPRFSDGMADPLALLAKMPFPVYITTSYHNFLERALIDEKKEPRTQVIFEEGKEYDDAADHYPDQTFNPTVTNPAVYHLFGLENYPGSLVLSEDDYMKFLVSVVSDNNTQKAVVPPRLRRALANTHLLLLGYHMRDWDFRVLFRFILNYRQTDESAKKSIFIQQEPRKGDKHLHDYLEHYFNMKRFEIEWDTSEIFVQKLWKVWKGQQP